MIQIMKATANHIEGIARVCAEGYRQTYKKLCAKEYIDRTIQEFYNVDRLQSELEKPEGWDGWIVAVENNVVIGAGGGGMIGDEEGELFVLYLDPTRRGEGIGTLLLEEITRLQVENGAKYQWVSVLKDNEKGIPFYEARGFKFVSEVSTFAAKDTDPYISLRYKRKLL
ncbi:GNAT family N-acetyltransferase [Bacillus suaedaesalsae]|uniref:GNAT family N-acetyltransferase n=1 Tax=Bacillus suaedaesalsae TaxID=2810349 RepID=A0ABS2DM09_9BACI|nr:GNAT family N-acetyltransferase [Bacillus suaedaesalsae]MBM6619441.1 GNAT family N-acetyltransferase [Bacillus suaedaesalsae]